MSKININTLLADPSTINQICDNVASGGSLIDLCNTWQVRYCDVMRWINDNNERKAAYAQAINDRGEWFIQRVLKEIQLMGTVDFAEAFDKNGKLKSPADMPEAITRSINSIDVHEMPEEIGGGVVKKLKFESKLKALEMLGKNMFMFVEKKMVMTGDQTDSKFRDEFFGIGKKQQDSTTTGAVKNL